MSTKRVKLQRRKRCNPPRKPAASKNPTFDTRVEGPPAPRVVWTNCQTDAAVERCKSANDVVRFAVRTIGDAVTAESDWYLLPFELSRPAQKFVLALCELEGVTSIAAGRTTVRIHASVDTWNAIRSKVQIALANPLAWRRIPKHYPWSPVTVVVTGEDDAEWSYASALDEPSFDPGDADKMESRAALTPDKRLSKRSTVFANLGTRVN